MSRGYGCLVGAGCGGEGATDQSMPLNERPAWAMAGNHARLAVTSTLSMRRANAFITNSFRLQVQDVSGDSVVDQSRPLSAMPAWATVGSHTRVAVVSTLSRRTANAFMTSPFGCRCRTCRPAHLFLRMSRGYGCLVGASCSSRVRGETNAPRRGGSPWGVTDQSVALNEMPAWATGGSNTRLAVKAKVSTARTRTANAFTRNSFGL